MTDDSRYVGPYRLGDRLGVGGMGEVYRAFDERLERWVAVKLVRTDLEANEDARTRLRREARSAASLSHPSIVQVHDVVESNDGDAIVL
ncbi:MAG: protein kinase, partial [Thermoanaerobaculia bacterium]|nr:protein kinase [Thermoanaerobaculia bacterium]